MSPGRARPGRTLLVVGTGLIGTSLALALRARGHDVLLADRNEKHLAHAERLGAGRRHAGEQVEVAVVAVPPRSVAAVAAQLLESAGGCTVTDTASVKAQPLRELEARLSGSGGGVSHFVGGHPLAGRERGGPGAARADLFAGRPWILTPSATTSAAALRDARWLVEECAATAAVMSPDDHDRALALTSHLPQLVASALAARLDAQPDEVVALVGQGLRDMTRIANSDPSLWVEIATGNAHSLAEEVGLFTRRLEAVAKALAAGASTVALAELLAAGRAGYRRIPDKHGGAPRRYVAVAVLVPDRPGEFARLFADAAAARVNIEDVRVDHAPGLPVGVIELFVDPDAAAALSAALSTLGWTIAEEPGHG